MQIKTPMLLPGSIGGGVTGSSRRRRAGYRRSGADATRLPIGCSSRFKLTKDAQGLLVTKVDGDGPAAEKNIPWWDTLPGRSVDHRGS